MNRPVEARASSPLQSLGFGKKAEISTDAPIGFPGLRHTPQLLARGRRALSRSNSKDVSSRDLTYTICELFLYKALKSALVDPSDER
jgi:hypothetical protein